MKNFYLLATRLFNQPIIIMNLAVAERLAKDLIKKHLGNSKNKWNFKWSHAKQSFGSCNVRRYGAFGDMICTIRISKHLVSINDEARVTNTILHEIAHALQWDKSGYMSHDYEWVSIAKSIGCDGEVYYTSEDVNQPQSKYSLVCGTCGYKAKAHRKPKRAKACGKCCKAHNNGKFSHDYVLELKANY